MAPANTVVPLAPRIERRPNASPQSWADVVDDTWTVPKVRAALTSHVNGLFADSSRLVDAMLGDDRISADVRTRALAVTGLPFRIEPSPIGDQRRAKAVAKELESLWPFVAPQAVLHDMVRWSVLMGFAVATCSWETSSRRWVPRLTFWHPQHTDWRDHDRSVHAMTRDGDVVIAPGAGSWVWHAPDGARPWMEGAVRALAIQWMARQYAMRDQSRDSEKFGLHVMGAVVPQEADKQEKEAFFSDLRRLGSEGLVMLPRDREDRGFDVKYLDPGTPAWQGFGALIERCDRSIATRILGQSNTASGDGGSYAKAIALDAIRQDLLESDARSLAETLHTQVLRPWARYNFGSADLAPRPVWDARPPADTSSLAATHKTAGESISLWSAAAASAGLAVDVEALAQTYGVPLKRAPETTPPPAPSTSPASEIVRQLESRGVLAATSATPADLAVGQSYVDDVVARGTATGARALRGTLGALAAAIEAAESPEALRARLLEILGADDPAALAAALARAQTLAAMAGRYDVIDDL